MPNIHGKERPSKKKNADIKPSPSMLGSGTAKEAGTSLKSRKARIDAAVRRIK